MCVELSAPIEKGAQIKESWSFEDRMRCKGRERGVDGPRGGATGRAVSTGFPESDNTAFGEGEGKTCGAPLYTAESEEAWQQVLDLNPKP